MDGAQRLCRVCRKLPLAMRKHTPSAAWRSSSAAHRCKSRLVADTGGRAVACSVRDVGFISWGRGPRGYRSRPYRTKGQYPRERRSRIDLRQTNNRLPPLCKKPSLRAIPPKCCCSPVLRPACSCPPVPVRKSGTIVAWIAGSIAPIIGWIDAGIGSIIAWTAKAIASIEPRLAGRTGRIVGRRTNIRNRDSRMLRAIAESHFRPEGPTDTSRGL